MITVRVRRAASTSIPERSRAAGGVISRSLLSGSHRARTPMLTSTSTIWLTSSIRARLRKVVRPWLSSGAQQRDGGVLAGLDVDRTGQLRSADDAQVLSTGVAQ